MSTATPTPVVPSAPVATPAPVAAGGPGFGTTELWFATAAAGAAVYTLTTLGNDLPTLAQALPPWTVALVPLAKVGITALTAFLSKWYMDHRRQLKLAGATTSTPGQAAAAVAALP